MNNLLVIGILAVIILAVTAKKPTEAAGIAEAAGESTLDELYVKHGQQNGLDPMLLKAVAMVESSENPKAKNPLDPSYGLMQILCVSDGKGGCKNRFNILDWPPDSQQSLYDPDISLHYGAQILAWNIKTYGFKRGIAVYNRWESRLDPENGPFGNQRYVDKVISHYIALGGRV